MRAIAGLARCTKETVEGYGVFGLRTQWEKRLAIEEALRKLGWAELIRTTTDDSGTRIAADAVANVVPLQTRSGSSR